MHKIAVFPGSFDPITIGHQTILLRAVNLFDKIVVAVGNNSDKKYLFDIESRISHIKQIVNGNNKIVVESYEGLTVNYCKTIGANYILRGLRITVDFEIEKGIAQANKTLTGIETIFLISDPLYSGISSTIVRDIYRNKGDISAFIPQGLKL
jgi:pantetheine-phosphate adenylyltransferase